MVPKRYTEAPWTIELDDTIGNYGSYKLVELADKEQTVEESVGEEGYDLEKGCVELEKVNNISILSKAPEMYKLLLDMRESLETSSDENIKKHQARLQEILDRISEY